MNTKERPDLTIKCICGKDAAVFEIWKALTFQGYMYRCECGMKFEIPSKYQGQIKPKT